MRNSKQILLAVFFVFLFCSQVVLADEQAQVQAEDKTQEQYIAEFRAREKQEDTSQEHYRQVYEQQQKYEKEHPPSKEELAVREFDLQHIVINEKGGREVKAVGVFKEPTIVGNQIVTPQGEFIGLPKGGIDQMIKERQEALEAHRIWQDKTRKKIYGDNPDAETQVLIEESKARDQKYLEEEAKRIEEFRLAGENYRKAEQRGLGVHYTISAHRKKIYGDNSNAKTQAFIEEGKVRAEFFSEFDLMPVA